MTSENDYLARAREIIVENKYMTVAASSRDGKPWVAPLAYAFDGGCRFYWVSHRESLHSRLIEVNPEVAIVIFDSNAAEGAAEGIYFEATAVALEETAEIEAAILLVNGRRATDAFGYASTEQVSGGAVKRIYRASPHSVSRLADDFVDGQRINLRLPIDLTALQFNA
jgi:nitroimidazol reductase NimA-like FMN-containing flavoprotein (pyridoxamine 5'-phosphate oxidase superfamily)